MEHERTLREYLVSAAEDLEIELRPEEVRKFFIYLNELKTWNEKINLTAVVNEKEIIVKHFVDSLIGTKVIDKNSKSFILDVGSGGGFPGIPLKIVREDLSLILIEPNKRKVAFLRHILGCLQLPGITVFQGNFLKFCDSNSGQNIIGWIVTRALNVEDLMPQFKSVLQNNGKIMLYRSKPYEERCNTKLRIDRQISYQLPHGFGERILTILKLIDD